MWSFYVLLQFISSWVGVCVCVCESVDINPSKQHCQLACVYVCSTRFTHPVCYVIGQGTAQDIPQGFQALYLVRRAISKIRRTRFTPQLPVGRVGKDQPGLDEPACVLCFSLHPSLLASHQVIDMWRSLIPYGPERGGIHHSLPVPPPPPHLSSLSPIQPQYHKLSVKLTGPSTISQGSCVAHRTLLYLICSPRHRPLTQASHQGVCMCLYVFKT